LALLMTAVKKLMLLTQVMRQTRVTLLMQVMQQTRQMQLMQLTHLMANSLCE
jgi:hypothetical protein